MNIEHSINSSVFEAKGHGYELVATLPTRNEEQIITLSRLYLSENLRGTGLAQMLIELLVKNCSVGIKHIEVLLQPFNHKDRERSLAFLKKMGFVVIGKTNELRLYL